MRFDAFASYNRRDRVDVLMVLDALERSQITTFRDQMNLVPGRDWRTEIEQAIAASRNILVFVGAHGLGDMQRWEINRAIAKLTAEQGTGIIPVLLPGHDLERSPLGELERFTWVDISDRSSVSIDELAAAVRGERPLSVVARVEEARLNRNPFRGLQSFREDDAPYFFGREAETKDLADVVQSRRAVLLVGASGSGKSSIVSAGLLPMLRREISRDVWSVLTLRPQADPLLSLARAVTVALNGASSPVEAEVEALRLRQALASPAAGSRGLIANLIAEQVSRLPQAGRAAPTRILIVIDQLEELFTLSDDEATRHSFAEQLFTAATSTSFPIHVLGSFRADQYQQLLAAPELSRLFRDSQLNIGPMQPDSLRRAIEQPAAKAGLRFEEGLLRTILGDMRGGADALPLLEFLLDQLWRLSRAAGSRMLTGAQYQNVGGVQGAIALHAEEVFAGLEAPQQALLRTLLVGRLVRVGRHAMDSRRPLTDLAALPATEHTLVNRLADERLLVVNENSAELTHEALLREWDRLKRWIDEERRDLLFRDRLDDDASEWAAQGADVETGKHIIGDKFLLREAGVAEAARLRATKPYLLSGYPHVEAFLDASAGHQKKLADANLAADRRLRFRTNVMWYSLAVIAFVLLSSTGLMWWLGRQAGAARDDARLGLKDAVHASSSIVNGVATTLGRTDGVPPEAVAKVLSQAKQTLASTSDKLKAIYDSDGALRIVQELTVIDAELLTAETALKSGSWQSAGVAVASARTQLQHICTEPQSSECWLRLSRLSLLSAMQAFGQKPDTVLDQVAAGLQVANEAASAAAGSSEPEVARDLGLLGARARAFAGRRLLLAAVAPGAAEADRTKWLGQALALVTPCQDQSSLGGATAVAAADTRDAAVAAAHCQQIRAEALAADGNVTDALAVIKSLATAFGKAGAETGADAKDIERQTIDALVWMSAGHIQLLPEKATAAATAAVPVASGAAAQAAAKATATALDLLVKGRAELERLIAHNPDNLDLKELYIGMSGLIGGDYAREQEASRSLLPEDVYTDLLEKRAAFLANRLAKLDLSNNAGEVSVRRMALALTARDLYAVLFRADQQVRIVEQWTTIKDLLKIDGATDDGYILAVLTCQYWAGQAYHGTRNEPDAIKSFLSLNQTAHGHHVIDAMVAAASTDAATQTTSEDELALYRYFDGYSVRFLSTVDVEQIGFDSPARKLLDRIESIVKTAREDDPDNIEFQTAYGDILAGQGRVLERLPDIQGAQAKYLAAAQQGSTAAVNRLREWYLTPGGPLVPDRGSAAQATELERHRRELAPLLVSVEGQSRILPGARLFNVYLVPERAGYDPIASEIKRLKTYYGVELDSASLARLKEIYTKAKSMSKSIDSATAYTSRELRSEWDGIHQQAEQASSVGNATNVALLKDAETALKDGAHAKAIATLDQIKSTLGPVINVENEDEIRTWGVLGVTYLDWALSQLPKDETSAKGDALIGGEIIERINSAVAASLNSKAGVMQLRRKRARNQASEMMIIADRLQGVFERYRLADDVHYFDRESGIGFSDRYNKLLSEIVASHNELILSLVAGSAATPEDYQRLAKGEYQQAKYLIQSARTRLNPKLANRGVDRTRGNEDARSANEALIKSQTRISDLASYGPLPLEARKLEVKVLIESADFHALLGENDAATRAWHGAVAAANRLMASFPTDLDVRVLAAIVHEDFGDYTLALMHDYKDQAESYLEAINFPKGNDQAFAHRRLMKKYSKNFDDQRDRSNISGGSAACSDSIRAITARESETPDASMTKSTDIRAKAAALDKKSTTTPADPAASNAQDDSKLDTEDDLYWRAQEFIRCAIDLRITVLGIDPLQDCACHVSSDISKVIDILGERREFLGIDAELYEVQKFVEERTKKWDDIEKLYQDKPRDLMNNLAIYKASISSAYARAQILHGQGTLSERYHKALTAFLKAEDELHDRRSVDPTTDNNYSMILSDLAFTYLMLPDDGGAADDNFTKALDVIKRAKEFYNSTQNVDINSAHVSLLRGDFDIALQTYKKYSGKPIANGADTTVIQQVRADLDQLGLVYTNSKPAALIARAQSELAQLR